ncbi:MAG: ferrochelatase [Nitrosomonas sp.]|nr:ferrochelatase [Nitrosomonas sp.]MCW5606708.1 ferrochelatase [Nitrosomonas sp.]
MHTESDYQHGSPESIGILLINLGTPESPTAAALRPYLREFLSNPRVIEVPRIIWWPILYGFILPFRPRQSAEKYALIWTPEGSPLKVHTERQTALLAERLHNTLNARVIVEYAMNIGNPSVASVLDKMKGAGCNRILVIPLFPQYAASSTAAAMDATFAALSRMRNMPAIRTVKQYHDHPGYIAALTQNIRDYWEQHGQPDKLIISFHGIPRKNLEKGDPYYCFCQKTGRLLAEALNLDHAQYQICFQSRFGRAQWLQPYTADTLKNLGRAKTRRIDVVCPGFVADCLETLEEIAIEGKKIFTEAGGNDYHYIPCLNERSDWIAALADIAQSNLQGWLESEPASSETFYQSKTRALQLGATK